MTTDILKYDGLVVMCYSCILERYWCGVIRVFWRDICVVDYLGHIHAVYLYIGYYLDTRIYMDPPPSVGGGGHVNMS